MRRAADYFRLQVARHGGYVYFYSVDLEQRFGEGVASPDQIWVQPPGTPTVGMAYLSAYEATGDAFYLASATAAAEALMYGQLVSGGWANCVDFNPRGARVAQYRNGQGRGRNYSSLDDDQSQAALRFLMRLDRMLKFSRADVHESVHVALEALLQAQYPNGAFPQGWDRPVRQDLPSVAASFPDYDWKTEGRIKNYWDMYTLNDDLASSVSQVLIDAHQTYGDERFQAALVRLGEFLLLAQMPEPQPGWSQQYGYEMHPIWARKFEPPAIAGRESQDALATLLAIAEYTGELRFAKPVPAALAYLRRSLLPDGHLARYYELKTNRPLYMQRSGQDYTLTYDDRRLPNHYGWKTAAQLDELEARHRAIVAGQPWTRGEPSDDALGHRAAAILAALDEQGRWISTFAGERLLGDQKFRPGDRYIASAVFSEHVETLSAYLRRSRNQPQHPHK